MRRMLLACFVLAVLGTTPAQAREGALTQLAGQSGCVSDSGSGGQCGDGVQMQYPSETALSPDGRFLYVAATNSDAISVFDRDPVTGTIAQKFGTIGCVRETDPLDQCTDVRGIDGVDGLVVSPDGLTLYATGYNADTIAVLDIDQSTGTLSQDAGLAGCVSETGAGACADGKALDGANGIALSPSGASLYVASYLSDAVAVFDRDPVGNLTQKGGSAGCVSDEGTGGACQDGRGLDGPYPGITVTSDGKSVYVPSLLGGAIAVLDRASDGSLTQQPGTTGCVQDTGQDGCADGRALGRPDFLLAAPNGKRLYSSNSISNSVAVFERAADGSIAQKTGYAGCVSEDGSAGECTDGYALDDPAGLGMSRDGATLYVTSRVSDAVAIFDIDATSGALAQLPGTLGCMASATLGGTCTAASGLGGIRGRFSVSPDGAFAYGAGAEDDTVTVFARSPNLRPTCTPLSGSTPFGQSLLLQLACSDADADPFKIRIAEGPRGGVTPDLNNFTSTVTYVPSLGFTGADIFTYAAEDAGGVGAPAAVTLTVGPGSLAGPGTGTTTTPKKKTAAPRTVGITRLATVPSNKKCLSRRSFKIKLRNVKAGKIVSAQVKLRGKVVRTLKGKTLSVSVNLKGLPKGTFTLEIVTTDSSGSRLSGKRRYKTCAVKKKAKAKPKKQTAK